MKRTASLLAAAVAAAGVWVLYTFPPAAYSFYPRCVFFTLTGMQCPGCGITRASHQLLHGHVEQAFRLNPMLFALIGLTLYALPSLVRRERPRFLASPAFAWGAFLVITAFWIVRNTPWWPWPL
ncbi:MAG: DUF2752 domain-containing protein [Acidobacteriota bacterium]